MIQKIDNATVREAVQQAYERCKNETGGKNADYIPYLANVPSNRLPWAIPAWRQRLHRTEPFR